MKRTSGWLIFLTVELNFTFFLQEVLLLIIDWLQVVQLVIAPDFGWHESTFEWVDKISVLRLLLPKQSATSFNIGEFTIVFKFVVLTWNLNTVYVKLYSIWNLTGYHMDVFARYVGFRYYRNVARHFSIDSYVLHVQTQMPSMLAGN